MKDATRQFFQRAWLEGEDKWFQYLVVLLVTLLGGYAIVGQLPLGVAIIYPVFSQGMDNVEMQTYLEEVQSSMSPDLIGIDQNLLIVLMLTIFVVAMAFFYWIYRKMHKRSFRRLITPFAHLDWGKIGFGFGVWLFILAALEGVSFVLDPDNYVYQFEAMEFVPLLLICIVMLPIQTTFEELLFRGYLTHGFGFWFRSRLIALLLPAVLFGAMHFANPEVGNYGFALMATYYISMGLFLGIITLMDDSCELAIGVHYANNLFGFLLVAAPGSVITTPALFRVEEVDMNGAMPFYIGMLVLFIIIAALRYGWRDWSRLYGDIELPPKPAETPSMLISDTQLDSELLDDQT